MIPFIMMALSLAQKKQQQNQADNERISNSLNLGDNKQSTQLQIPNGNGLGGIMGNGQQGGAMNLLGSLFNKKDQNGF
jgi:hypothetical protein